MDKHEMFQVFGEFDPAEYEDEVKERWGDTDAYRESTRRAATYTKADWERIQAEGGRNLTALAARMTAGASPTDTDVMALAEEHRLQIDQNFYPCSHEMHVGLGEMYVADPRFTAVYDKIQPGLAAFLSQAIKANADRYEAIVGNG